MESPRRTVGLRARGSVVDERNARDVLGEGGDTEVGREARHAALARPEPSGAEVAPCACGDAV